MTTYKRACWICWAASGLVFAVDTTCVLVDSAHANHPIHGVLRILVLAGFVSAWVFWLADELAVYIPVPGPAPATVGSSDPAIEGRYLADMAESVRLGREIERRKQGPPEEG